MLCRERGKKCRDLKKFTTCLEIIAARNERIKPATLGNSTPKSNTQKTLDSATETMDNTTPEAAMLNTGPYSA